MPKIYNITITEPQVAVYLTTIEAESEEEAIKRAREGDCDLQLAETRELGIAGVYGEVTVDSVEDLESEEVVPLPGDDDG